mmetsp:Transcript_29367/g.86804  ORF Transcript_29367/g.86804 Transcript_29367/m.86804 type:complete len:206 (+) Transcript_29367:659-1276(+)
MRFSEVIRCKASDVRRWAIPLEWADMKMHALSIWARFSHKVGHDVLPRTDAPRTNDLVTPQGLGHRISLPCQRCATKVVGQHVIRHSWYLFKPPHKGKEALCRLLRTSNAHDTKMSRRLGLKGRCALAGARVRLLVQAVCLLIEVGRQMAQGAVPLDGVDGMPQLVHLDDAVTAGCVNSNCGLERTEKRCKPGLHGVEIGFCNVT